MKLLAAGAIIAASFLTPERAAPETPIPASAKCRQYWRTALAAGWREHDLPLLDAIIWRESRCKPNVENPNDPWGGSIGLLQVNRGWIRWLRELGVIEHSSDLYNPHHNLAAGRAIYEYACSRHGHCWIAWGILSA